MSTAAPTTVPPANEMPAHDRNFRTFVESLRDLVVITTPEGQILYSNQALREKLGYDAADLAQLRVLDLHPAAVRAEAEKIFTAMFRGERSSCPLPLRTKSGELFPVETRVWFGEWNGTACIFGLSKDLSSEIEAHQRFERLFHNNPALMVVSEMPSQRIIDVNQAVLDTLGYARSDMIGRTTTDLGLFVSLEQHQATADLLQARGRITNVELQIRRRDGAVLDGMFSGEIIRSQGKDYFLTVMLDITARKQAEKTALALLERERLLSAKKTQFISIASHEFRTPLAAAVGNLELIRRHGAELTAEKQAHILERTAQSLDRLTTIMDEVLTLTRADSGKVPVRRAPFDLDGLIRSVIRTAEEADRQQHHFAYHPVAAPLIAPFDRNLLEHILGNLLSNAVRYSPAGTAITVTVKLAGRQVVLEVADDGIGIPAAERDQIFEPFVRGSNVGSISGTGLGLNIVKRYAELLGGQISLVPSPRGATFRLELPCD